MKKILFKLFNKFLKRSFKFDYNIPLTYLLGLVFRRTKMIMRGFMKGFFLKKGKRFFLGKKVSLICKKKMTFGTGVSINDYVYIDAMSKEGLILGNNVSLGMRTMIRISGSLEKIGKGVKIGDNSALGNDCFIGGAGGVTIGSDVAIGQNVRFHSENHEFKDVAEKISDQGVSNKGIIIEDDCWIGAGVVFLDGVVIGKGSIIGANSVVTKSIDPYSIVAGVPARVIRKR